MSGPVLRPLAEALSDVSSMHLTESERKVKFRNAKKFVAIFLKSNPSMKRGLTKADTKTIIQKMMIVLSLKDINKKNDREEANKCLTDNITIIKEKRNKKDTNVNEDITMGKAEGNKTQEEKEEEEKVGDEHGEVRKDETSTEKKNGGENKEKENTDEGDGQKKSAVEVLLASNMPRQPRRNAGVPPKDTTVMFPLKFECRFELISVSEEDRKAELREKYDLVIGIIRKGGIKAVFLPLKDPEGKGVPNLASKRGVIFAGDQPEVLPNLAAYGSEWLAKKEWMTVTAMFHISCSVKLSELYMRKAKSLLKKYITMSPKRINMRHECNVPVAVVLPSFSSLDAKGLSFFFHSKYGIYITFELVKIVDGKWVQCGFKDDLCIGFAIVVNGDMITEALKGIKVEWPFTGRRKDSYPLGFKMAAFPLDENLNIHKIALERAKKEKKDIVMCMHADYQHSRLKVIAGGGAVYMKFVASVESCSLQIKRNDGSMTNLREIVTSFKDDVTGKPLIANISPMPSQEDAGSVYTNFTTHRAANEGVTAEIAVRAEKFIRYKLAGEIWKMLPSVEARKVLAPAICGKLSMANSVTLEDVADDMPIFEIEGVEVQELDENSIRSEYEDKSTMSGITIESSKTTNSTRQRLVETQQERDELEETNAQLREDAISQKANLDRLVEILKMQSLDEETTRAIENLTGTIAELGGDSDDEEEDEKEVEEEEDYDEDDEDESKGDENTESVDEKSVDDESNSGEVTKEMEIQVDEDDERNKGGTDSRMARVRDVDSDGGTPKRFKKTAMKTVLRNSPSTGTLRSPNQVTYAASVQGRDGMRTTRGASKKMAAGIG